MKTSIYWFSGTGNSLWIAKQLAAHLQADLVPIATTATEKPVTAQGDAVGIIFPVYMFGTPLIVNRFAARLRPAPGAYIFAVATYGGIPGAALEILDSTLRSNGTGLAGAFGIRMPGNYTPLYGAMSANRQEKMFMAAKKQTEAIAESVSRRETAHFGGVGHRLALPFFRALYRAGSPRVPGMDSGFLSTSRCNGCGICEKVCSQRNIRMENMRPAWLHHCEQCMACLQWCPEEAIELGKATVGRKRYRCPDSRASDFFLNR